MAVSFADAHFRWWFSGVAALATHGAVLLGIPDAPEVRSEPPAALWMTVVTTGQTGANADASAASPGGMSAGVSSPSTAPARRRSTVARARPSGTPHVAPSEQKLEPERSAGAGELAGASSALAAALEAEPSVGSITRQGSSAGQGMGPTAGEGSGPGQGVAGVTAPGAPTVRPALLATRNPCLGFFPAGAHVDHGRVQIQVRVDESGHARAGEVVVEAPLGHDFGRAARACAAALRFAPARDALGIAVAGEAKLELHFHRS